MYDTTSRVSVSSTSIVVESEVSTDIRNSAPSPFPAIPLSQSGSFSQQNGERLAVSGEDWEERLLTRQLSKKASAEGEGSSSQSTWERLKNSISRSTSSAGRRSRSNSIINRERNSSISRESGASLTSGGKGDRTSFAASSQQQSSQHPVAPPLMQSPSASASISSLAPPHHMRGNPSPIPPASDADRMKYQNDKLFPFPGMKRLEEQRRDRAKGPFPDTPAAGDDVPTPLSAQSFSQPQTPDIRDCESCA
jgi:serine/arginine repetitive matrix protein 2